MCASRLAVWQVSNYVSQFRMIHVAGLGKAVEVVPCQNVCFMAGTRRVRLQVIYQLLFIPG